MNFTISLIVLLTTSVLAAPTSSELPEKGALVCNDPNFEGYCDQIYAPASQCSHLVGYSFDQLSSVRPNEGSFCYFYVSGHCNSDEDLEFFHVGYPGVADLAKMSVNGPVGSTHDFDNKLQSFLCVDDE